MIFFNQITPPAVLLNYKLTFLDSRSSCWLNKAENRNANIVHDAGNEK